MKEKVERFSIKKLSVGVASIAVAAFIFTGVASADESSGEASTIQSEANSEKDKESKAETPDAVINITKDTNSNLIEGKEFNGKYGVNVTVKDKEGTEHKTTYGGYSLINVDKASNIKADFTLENGATDINANIILTVPNYTAGGKSSLVFDGSKIDKEKGITVTSKLGEDYSSLLRYGNANGEYIPLLDYKNKYGADAFGENLRAVRLDGGTIKANDKIDFSLDFKLKEKVTEVPSQSATFEIYNFINGHNGYVTDNLVLGLVHEEKIGNGRLLDKKVLPVYRPEGEPAKDGGSLWVYVPELQDLMPTPDKMYRFGNIQNPRIPEKNIISEKDENGYYKVKSEATGDYPNVTPYYFLMLTEAQNNIHTHGYTANPTLIQRGYYAYGGGARGISVENYEKEKFDGAKNEGAQILHFQVIPSILLKDNQVHKVVSASSENKIWDPKTMVKQFTNPSIVKWLVEENDSRQLDKKTLNVEITDITDESNTKKVNEVSLLKPGKYKVVYSHVFKDDAGKDLPISNTGYVSVVTDKQKMQIRIIDDVTKEVTLSDSFDGESNKEAPKQAINKKIEELKTAYLALGYKFENSTEIPENFDATENTEDNKDNEVQYIDVHFSHDIKEIREYKDAIRKINYTGAGDKTPVAVESIEKDAFVKVITIDKVTKKEVGEVKYEGSKEFSEIATPVIKGYTADKSSAGKASLSWGSPSYEETVTYVKDADVVTEDSKKVTRTIKVIKPNGEEETIEQQVVFTRSKTIDPATDEITFGEWSEGGKHKFEEYEAPKIKGYTADKKIAALEVTPESEDSVVVINYVKDADVVTEDSKKVTRTIKVIKPNGEEETIEQQVVFTRRKTTDPATDEITFGEWSEGGKHKFEEYEAPKIKGYTADKKIAALEVTPESEDSVVVINYVKDADVVTEDSKKVTRTIKVIKPNGEEETIEQQVVFTRSKTTDPATDEITFGEWSEGGKHRFEEYEAPKIKGYTADKKIAALEVTPESEDSVVVINYVKDAEPVKPQKPEESKKDEIKTKKQETVEKTENIEKITLPKTSSTPTNEVGLVAGVLAAGLIATRRKIK